MASEIVLSVNASSHHGSDLYQRHVAGSREGSKHGSTGGPLQIEAPPDCARPLETHSLAAFLASSCKLLCWKVEGGQDDAPAVPKCLDIFWSWLGAFLGILLIAGLNQWLAPTFELTVLYASFGASAVLVFGVITSPLAQPRALIGGQVMSAIVGCAVRAAFAQTDLIWLSAALGMSLALVAMQLTRTTHPPGGATALIAATANPMAPWYGFQFVVDVLIGSIALFVVAMLVNNLHFHKRYPTYWWG